MKRFGKSIDRFGEGLNLKLDGGVDAFQSHCGALCTIFTAVIVGLYMLLKINTIV